MNIVIKLNCTLKNVIIDPQISDTWKTQLSMASNFISSKDTKKST